MKNRTCLLVTERITFLKKVVCPVFISESIFFTEENTDSVTSVRFNRSYTNFN